MNTVTVRQAGLTDLDAMADLFNQYRQFQGQADDLSGCRAFLHDRLDRSESIVFFAVVGAHQVGFAQMYPSFSSTALARVFILNDLYVCESGRRGGVGSALLKAVEGHAWSLGACRVSLNVAQLNLSAQGLYDAEGWIRDKEFFMYHRYPSKP